MQATLHINLARCNRYLALLNGGETAYAPGSKIDWYYSEPFKDGNAVEVSLINGSATEPPYLTMALVDDRYNKIKYLDLDCLCEYHFFTNNDKKYMLRVVGV